VVTQRNIPPPAGRLSLDEPTGRRQRLAQGFPDEPTALVLVSVIGLSSRAACWRRDSLAALAFRRRKDRLTIATRNWASARPRGDGEEGSSRTP
jgi:hypothetical protein